MRPGSRVVLPVAISVLAVVTGAACGFGWSSLPVIAVAMIACILALAPRWGYLFAGALGCIIVFAGVLGALLVSARVSIGIAPVVAIVFGALGLGFGALLWRTGPPALWRPRATWWDLAGSCTGLVVWLIALAVSGRVPINERLGWLMRGDSLNNLILAHGVVRDSGIVLGPEANPVPLPAGLIALGILPGRTAGGPEVSLAHDLAGMGWTWALLIGLLSVLSGLVVATIVRSVARSGLASRLAAAGGSLLVLSWYLTGFPIEFGFFNLDVALPLLLVSYLLAVLADRSPRVATGGLAVASTLILATWSPLVLVPLSLLGVTILRHRAALWPRRTLPRVFLVLTALQLLLYAGLASLPSFLSQGSALGTSGGIYSQNALLVFPAAAVVLVVAFLLYRDRLRRAALPVAVVVSSGIALGVLLFLNRKNPTLWTYYPVKLAFFATALYLVVGFGLAAALIARQRPRSTVQRVGSVVLALVVAGVVVLAPGAAPGIVRLNPVARVTTSHPGETLVQQEDLVLAVAARGAPAVLWGTGRSYEPAVNLWLLQLHVDTLSGTSKLRLAAYVQVQSDHSVGELCRIARLVGPGLAVHTADPFLASKFHSSCPDATARFSALPPY